MKIIEKVVKHAFGKDVYLLGTNKEGIAYWLEQPTWNCGWYWGCGYVLTYTNNLHPDESKDINSLQHFDLMFLGKDMFVYWHEFFDESTLNDNELWQLWDYMQSIYTLKETAKLVGRGYSHITERSMCDSVKDTELCKRISEQMLPALFERVKQLLTNNEYKTMSNNKYYDGITSGVVESGEIRGYKWEIRVTRGSHPCAYVTIPDEHFVVESQMRDYYEVERECNINVHGGLTYMHGNEIGWDYAHSGDFTYYSLCPHEHKYTHEEIMEDIYRAIEALEQADKPKQIEQLEKQLEDEQ